MILEACVGSLSEALLAVSNGAHQLELCARLDLDGVSPTPKLVKTVGDHVSVPIKVIVNPFPYDYVYSDTRKVIILNYIQRILRLPISGIVMGPMTPDLIPDIDFLHEIRSLTDLPITFHKAIDTSNDILHATQLLVEHSATKFILSSGGADTAIRGVPMLKRMNKTLSQSQIELIAAGAITPSSLKVLHEELKIKYYHGSRIVGK